MKRIALCLVALCLALPVLGADPPKMTPAEEAKVQAFWDQFLPIERALFARITDAEFKAFMAEIDAPMKEWKQDKKASGQAFILKWRGAFQAAAKDYLENKDSARSKPRKADGSPWERLSEFEFAVINDHLFRIDYKTRANERKPSEQEIKDFCNVAVYKDRLCAQYKALSDEAIKKYLGPPVDNKVAETFLVNWRGLLRAELTEYLKAGAPKDMDQKKLIDESLARAQAAIKGMPPVAAGKEDKAAKEQREALAGKAKVLADKMAAVLNQRREAGELPDAQGTISVTPTSTGKGETVFTAADGRGTSVEVKKVADTEIGKLDAAAAEKLGTESAQQILNGNFRAARAAALTEAVRPENLPGANGSVPLPALGPGGMLGGSPGCGAAGADSLTDYQKKLERDAREKSAKSSAARQKLEGDYIQKYKQIMEAYAAAEAGAKANPLLSPAERAAAIKEAADKRDRALVELQKPVPAANAAISKQESEDASSTRVASMRAERLMRAQTAQRVETVRDAWEKDVSQVRKQASGDLAQFLTPALVRTYFNEEWGAGSPKFDANMDECIKQARFNDPASVDKFVGRHLSAWCQARKARFTPGGAPPDDLGSAAKKSLDALLKKP